MRGMKAKTRSKAALLLIFLTSLLLSGYTKASLVYDGVELFNEVQMRDLNDAAEQLSDQLEAQVLIVTLQEDYGNDIESFAEDFYEENRYGSKNGGIMFLIDIEDEENRAYCVYYNANFISDRSVEDISQSVRPYLKQGDYYGAAEEYLALVEQYSHGNGEVAEEPSILDSIFVRLGIAVLVSGVVVLIMVLARNHDSKPAGQTYLSDKGVKINQQFDRFSHTTVITHKIQREDNNHNSGDSSGWSSGGHGGSF